MAWSPGRKVAGAAVALTAARGVDLGTTAALDVQLKGEQNLLHAAGGGFGALLATNALVLVGLIVLMARSVQAGRAVERPDPKQGPQAFLSGLFFARRYPWWHIAWRTPKGARGRWLLGRVAFAVAIVVSLAAAAGNVLSYTSPGFAAFWAGAVGGPLRLVAALGVIVLAAAVAWVAVEYVHHHRRARRTAARATHPAARPSAPLVATAAFVVASA